MERRFVERLGAGAALGARSATIYAAVECAAIVLSPLLGASRLASPPLLPGYLLLLFATYGLLGALAGAGLGALFRSGLPALATLAVILAHAAHGVRVFAPGPSLVLALGVDAAIAACLAAAALSDRAAARLRFVANPWSASVLAIGAGALLFEPLRHEPLGAKLAAALVWTAGGVLVSLAVASSAARWGAIARDPRPLRALGAAALAAAAAFVLAAVAPRAPVPELPPPVAASADHPDVVLITLDTVRSDHLSVYGYERDTTLELEAFARSATLYTRAVAASNLTLPTHASLFTGLYSRHHGAHTDRQLGAMGLAERFRTLAEVLGDAGYLTLAVVGNPAYLAARLGFDQGFDHYDETHPTPFFPELRPHFAARSLGSALEAVVPVPGTFERAELAYRRAGEINRAIFALFDRIDDRRRPLLLFVNYMDAHWPYDPPPPFDTRYPGRLPPHLQPGLDDFTALQRLERRFRPGERRHMVSQYDGEIAYLDRELGRLFQRFRDLGRWEGALIVVTADHGEALGDHGLLAHGVSLHQHQVHVPLLVKYPHQSEAVVSDALTSSVDIMPTILGVAGLRVPDALPGVDLRAPPRGDRVVISETFPKARLARSHPRFRHPQRALFAGDLKLIVSESGARQLFDLSADPGELRDLHAKDVRGAELSRRLDDWLRARPAETGTRAVLDAETRARLEALGYER